MTLSVCKEDNILRFREYLSERVRTEWGSSALEKCFIMDSGEKPRVIVANFKVPRRGNGIWSREEEIYAIGSPSSASQCQQWKSKAGPIIRRRNTIQFSFPLKHFVPRVSKREGNCCYLLRWDFNSSGKIIRDNQKLTA